MTRIESLVRETGQTGFHFVDEAAPPKALKSLANALPGAGSWISPGGATFASRSHLIPNCAVLLAESGLHCGHRRLGSRVGSPAQIDEKRVSSVEQVARGHPCFRRRGHTRARLFDVRLSPARTAQDTVDALEYVRQLFAGRLYPVGLFPPLYVHGTFAGRQTSGTIRRHAGAPRSAPHLQTTTSTSRTSAGSTTIDSALPSKRRFIITCTASGSILMCVNGSKTSASNPGFKSRGRRRTGESVPRTTVACGYDRASAGPEAPACSSRSNKTVWRSL